MTSPDSPQKWNNFPIGPQTRMYIGLEPEIPENYTHFDQESFEVFTKYLETFIETHPAVSEEELVNVMQELVQMGIGDLAVRLHKVSEVIDLSNNFLGLLHLGSGALKANDLELAEGSFALAQKLVPEEPAPYVNLARLFFHQQKDELCEQWVQGGLEADLNYYGLWEVLGLLYQHKFQEQSGQKLREFAEQKHSWAGLSLSALLIDVDDKLLRVQLLEPIYESGERDVDFLIEYTAALGAAAIYDRVSSIVWDANKQSQQLPWQLNAHAAQSHIAMEQWPQAIHAIELALKSTDISEQAHTDLVSLREEAEQAIK
jgi:hypothetical protein